uniref:Uncharacterized protein n=1 Tax=Oryza sativa subsp. japonica TaxID=39947 RepID=Q69RG4_ORYSJ|nr:hypothetical protein [Oryza sativa Japonica Group]
MAIKDRFTGNPGRLTALATSGNGSLFVSSLYLGMSSTTLFSGPSSFEASFPERTLEVMELASNCYSRIEEDSIRAAYGRNLQWPSLFWGFLPTNCPPPRHAVAAVALTEPARTSAAASLPRITAGALFSSRAGCRRRPFAPRHHRSSPPFSSFAPAAVFAAPPPSARVPSSSAAAAAFALAAAVSRAAGHRR